MSDLPKTPIEGGFYIKARIIKHKKIANAAPHVREIWDYCLREANYKRKKYKCFYVDRGQLFRSYKDIQEALHWNIGWRKMVYSENQMKNAMRFLRENGMITTKRKPGGVLITVINYDFYQDASNYENTNDYTNEETNGKLLKNYCRPSNNKKEKNKKNKKNNTQDLKIHQKIIDYFNRTCGKSIRLQSGDNIRHISERLKEGYTFENFKIIIDSKNVEWAPGVTFIDQKTGKEKELRKFLHPDTLFIDKNFDKYLNQSIISNPHRNLKSKEEVYKLLKTAIESSSDKEEMFNAIRDADLEIYKATKDSPFLFEWKEQDFKRIYERYLEAAK